VHCTGLVYWLCTVHVIKSNLHTLSQLKAMFTYEDDDTCTTLIVPKTMILTSVMNFIISRCGQSIIS